MPFPITHLLWGYMVSRTLTRRPDAIMIGSAAAVVMDIPWIYDLHDFHRESTHYLAFIVLMTIVMLLYSREITIAGVVFANMFVHLFLDAIATRGEIVWFWPFSDWGLGYTGPHYFGAFLLLNLVISSIPVVFIILMYLLKKESPLTLASYLKDGSIKKAYGWSEKKD